MCILNAFEYTETLILAYFQKYEKQFKCFGELPL